MKEMKQYQETLNYYNSKTAEFTNNTVSVEFSKLQNEFASMVKPGGTVLDLGCGSGRDTLAFIKMGYQVIAVDGSTEMVKVAEKVSGHPVICSTFQEFTPDVMLDGIWACASLLHLDQNDIHDVVKRLSGCMNCSGCLYLSFKYGTFAGMRNGRFFTDLNEELLSKLLSDITTLTLVSTEITSDVRPGRESEKWLNAFYIKK